MSRSWLRAFLSASVAIMACGALVLAHAQSAGPIRGDVNADGKISALDALGVLSYAVGKTLPANFTVESHGDANGDGKVTAVDAQIALGFTVGKDVSQFPIGTPLATFSADLAGTGGIVIRQGWVATVEVELAVGGGFADSVSVTLDGLPAGVTSDTATLAPGTTAATLNLAATIDATLGDTTVTLRSRSPGHPDHTRPIPLKVVSAVHSLEIAPALPTMEYDETIEIAAIARDVKGEILVGRHVGWTGGTSGLAPNQEMIVSLPDHGDLIQITGTHEGSAFIFAVVDSVWATAQVTVGKAPVSRVEVTGASQELPLWESTQLTATPYSSRDRPLLNRSVSWSSSDPAVVEVDSAGVVTAVAYGSATITATIEGTVGLFEVVVPEAPLEAVWIDPDVMTGRVGETGQLTAQVIDQQLNEVTGYTVVWAVDDEAVATIDQTGLVTAIGEGSTLVRAWVEGQPEINGTAELYVRPAVGDVLEVSTSGDGTGTVGVSPEAEYYAPGTVVTLTAIPEAPSFFGGWSGDCTSDTTTCTLTMDGDMQVTASFRNTVRIDRAIASDGYGTGVLMADPSLSGYAPGTTVTITAVPGPYSVFREWYSGDFRDNDCEGTTPTCVLVTGTRDLYAMASIAGRKWTGELNGSYQVVEYGCTYQIELSASEVEFRRNEWKAIVDIWLTHTRTLAAREEGAVCSSGGTREIQVLVEDSSISGSLIETEASREWAGGTNDEYFSFTGEFVEDMQPFSGKLKVWTEDEGGSTLGTGEIDVTLSPE